MHPRSTLGIQRKMIVTGNVQSCGRVGHRTADTERQMIVGRVLTNPVSWRCRLKIHVDPCRDILPYSRQRFVQKRFQVNPDEEI
ncbi:hypothetical protein TNCV_1836381 [Trichonephila clavipes]|nr:hypothetical protein TNCV_1836381 [Trichonephila clavipes]